ncbi:ABC transporter substrate-binding protein [Alloiococcus sp. CFN-8]|uniref:ABC transporter substrate-binding protein n=1 Tax=Alloiococcus sp. CFN-8 TaxID=3416081 RepID=UPI003CF72003
MKKILSLIMAMTLAGSIVGCSKSASNEEAQGVTDTEILIANSAATSGSYAPVGVPFNAGLEAYLELINKDGGVNGRKIVFKHQDDEFDPVKGKAMLSQFIEDEEVFAIVGHFGTPVVGATIQDLKDSEIPAVYFATGIGQLYSDDAEADNMKNIFPVQPIYITEGQIMVARAVGDFKAKKLGIIYTNDDAGKDILNGAEAKAKELGVELVAEQVTAGATDVSSAVTTIKNADVDFIVLGSIQATFPTIVKELAAQGVDKDVITTYVNVSPVSAQAVVNEIKGKFDVYGNGWVSFEGERAEALAQFMEYCPDYADNVYAMTGWIAAHFFVEGLKRVEGTITWDKYIEAMEAEPIKNPFGGEINFADGLRAGTQEMNLSKINHENVQGEWIAVDGLKAMDSILGK